MSMYWDQPQLSYLLYMMLNVFCHWTLLLLIYVGKEGQIDLSHSKYAQHGCDKEMSCCRRLVSCLCNKSGLFFLIFLVDILGKLEKKLDSCLSVLVSSLPVLVLWGFLCSIFAWIRSSTVHCWIEYFITLDLNFADTKYSAASNHWQQFTNWGHIPDFANKRITTDLFPDKQVY